MATYTTKQGDMWDTIAYTQCGGTEMTDALMKKNMSYSGNFIFPAGVELTLPEKTADESSRLPPWKQVTK